MTQVKTCGCGRIYSGVEDFMKDTSRWRLCDDENLWFNCSCGSTLVLKKGMHDWYSPSLLMSSEAKSLFLQLKYEGKTPVIQSQLMSLVALIENPNTSSAQIAGEIRNEAFLSAELLKFHEHYFPGRPPSLERIISTLGRNATSLLVTAAALKAFPLETQHYSAELHWNFAYTAAGIGAIIAHDVGQKEGIDEIAIGCCFLKIGYLVGAIWKPEKIDSLYLYSEQKKVPWEEVQEDFFPYDFSVLGEVGSLLWGLPEFATTVASTKLNKLLGKKGRYSKLSAIAHLSHELTYERRGFLSRTQRETLLACCDTLGLNDLYLKKLRTQIQSIPLHRG